MSHHVFLSNDLIVEVLSFLNVKSLMRFKSVSKLWNILISNPTFVKLHYQRSASNMHLALTSQRGFLAFSFITFPLNHVIENPSITIPINPYNPLEDINDCSLIIGSCNGLLCLRGFSFAIELEQQNTWFRIWNPATNTISRRLGYRTCILSRLKYTFGYDNSTETYKVVVLSPTEVHILNLRDNSWRTISSFPPFHHVALKPGCRVNEGVYLSGTVNWFTIQSNVLGYDYYIFQRNNITVDQFVIISLDLGTETYMHLSLPRGVDEVPCVEPTIAVLMDCLCFSHNLNGTHFVIWKMAEFRVEQSWTQFLKISFQNLQVYDDKYSSYDWRFFRLFPLCLVENGRTLVLTSSDLDHAIFYNLRDNRVRKTSDNKIIWVVAKNYVESLASIC
ncbi:hypothetical protein TSUD_175440 [Trifolium subterraneum]|uniref:F-box domain-containing protein n=1 Tax=Trifolium subterraneum TaxID=3900 RepID=A0A2Z6NNM1_TRISU|nr:hypothetical protein TSUD_175440 [Trifolium subterraneum]